MAFTVALPEIYRGIDVAWDDAIQRSQFTVRAKAAQMCLQNQTAKISPMVEGTGPNAKDRTVRVYWINGCAITDGAATDECTAASATLADSQQDHALTSTREASFKVSWKAGRTTPHQLNEQVSVGMLSAMKALDEYLAKQFFTFLAAHNGTHEYSLNFGSLGAGDVWQIGAADWGVDLMPEWILAADFAHFDSPWLLHGLNLFTDAYKANQYKANADGKGENNLYGVIPADWDPVGATAASAQTMSWLINKGSVALGTGNYFDTAPRQFAGNHRVYKVASKNLPGIAYDVHELETCTSDDFVISYKLNVYFDYFLNPLGCVAGRTGILQFEKV